jgi:hypothetical protein
MNNTQMFAWQQRLQKEQAAVRKMMDSGVHTDTGLGNNRFAVDTVASLVNDGCNTGLVIRRQPQPPPRPNSGSKNHQQPLLTSAVADGSGSGRASALTATTTASGAARQKKKQMAAAAAMIPIQLPHRENRALRLLPNDPNYTPPQRMTKIELTKDQLEEQTYSKLMEAALARRNEERKLRGGGNEPPAAAPQQQQQQQRSASNNNKSASGADARSIASARSNQISSLLRENANNGGGGTDDAANKKPSSARAPRGSASSASSSVAAVGQWAAEVPASLPPIRSARGSAVGSESAFSSTTLSHHAASSALVSGVTSINRRLEAIEERIAGEKELRNDLRKALMEVRAIVEKSKALSAASSAARGRAAAASDAPAAGKKS